MTNIQKAIKFAENEIKSLELAPKINGCEMTELWKEQIEVWETAISAIEKQIPKNPKKKEENKYSAFYDCPCCGGYLVPKIDGELCYGYEYKYCYHCGQALDWSDTNE